MRIGILRASFVLIMVINSALTMAEFKVIGYVPTWANMDPTKIPYDKLTHINYAFAIPQSNGSLSQITTKNDSTKLRNLVTNAHANNVKVLISIGGISGSQNFPTIGASSSLRTTFTQKVLEMVAAFNLDGADVDWEFPNSTQDASNCSLLMKELSDSLHKYNKLSTMAVNPFGTYADYILSDIFPYVDFMNIMAYDNGTPHSSIGLASSAITYWSNRGLPDEKIILGVPFYGRNTSGIVYYKNLVASDAMAPYNDDILYNGKLTNYNGIPTIQEKTKLALKEAGGIMIWELSNDTNDNTSLLKAIASQIPVTSTEKGISNLELTIFPNPATSQIEFKFSNSMINHISISDLSGKKIMEITNVSETIDISNLEEGLYIITVVAGDKKAQKKLVISRK